MSSKDEKDKAALASMEKAFKRAPEIVFVIRFQPGEGLNVQGPLHDKMLCYAMLEVARDQVREYDPARDGNKILVPSGAVI